MVSASTSQDLPRSWVSHHSQWCSEGLVLPTPCWFVCLKYHVGASQLGWLLCILINLYYQIQHLLVVQGLFAHCWRRTVGRNSGTVHRWDFLCLLCRPFAEPHKLHRLWYIGICSMGKLWLMGKNKKFLQNERKSLCCYKSGNRSTTNNSSKLIKKHETVHRA